MKTKLLFTPSNPKLVEIDSQIVEYLTERGLDDTPTQTRLGIFEIIPPEGIKPFRQIDVWGTDEHLVIGQHLESLGLTQMLGGGQKLGSYDAVFLLDPPPLP